jgi:protein transport protein SEC24
MAEGVFFCLYITYKYCNCTGIRMTAFHGNFFVRQTDLLALPNVSRDHSYTIEVGIEENITTPTVCFQTALLHTTCFGL